MAKELKKNNMKVKNMAYYKAKHKASALKYRPPQANQTLVQGEKEAAKTSGGSVSQSRSMSLLCYTACCVRYSSVF